LTHPAPLGIMPSMSRCIKCSNKFSQKRAKLGYKTCLPCGDVAATRETLRKCRSVAPAFNKGAYTYVYSTEQAKSLGK
jgi:ribosomal protein L37AE/L43A